MFVIYVYVCVCDFGSENDKSEIYVFVICVSNYGPCMTRLGP